MERRENAAGPSTVAAPISVAVKRGPPAAVASPPAKRQRTSAPATGPLYLNGRIGVSPTSEVRTTNLMHIGSLIDSEHLKSAALYFFFIGEHELFDLLPRSTPSRRIIVGRDISQCPLRTLLPGGGVQLNRAGLEKARPALEAHYRTQYGIEATFTLCGGSAHSKFAFLEYAGFLRIIITSCNGMNQDFYESDNLTFYQDLPRRPENHTPSTKAKEFEQMLLDHAIQLNLPRDYIDGLRSQYDFNAVKVSLVPSKPGISRPPLSTDPHYGLLRLKQLIGQSTDIAAVEVCSASIGAIEKNEGSWVRQFAHAISGGKVAAVGEVGLKSVGLPPFTIVYPSRHDIVDWQKRGIMRLDPDQSAQFGCHMNWNETGKTMRGRFRRYQSTESEGTLTHQKTVLVWDKPSSAETDRPSWIYIGSANFSASAWGKLVSPTARLPAGIDISNFELGVMVRGVDIESMLEPGSNWDDMMTYARPAPKLSWEDKPFNSSIWFARE